MIGFRPLEGSGSLSSRCFTSLFYQHSCDISPNMQLALQYIQQTICWLHQTILKPLPTSVDINVVSANVCEKRFS